MTENLTLTRAAIIWLIVFVWGLVAMMMLTNEQRDDTRPGYTCAPGTAYTTAECP